MDLMPKLIVVQYEKLFYLLQDQDGLIVKIIKKDYIYTLPFISSTLHSNDENLFLTEVCRSLELFFNNEKEDSQDPEVFLHTSRDGLIPGSESAQRKGIEADPQISERKIRRISPDLSPPRRGRHDSPDLSPPQRGRHDSPDLSPPRRGRHDSPDLSPPRRGRHDSPDLSPPRRGRHDSPDLSPPGRGHHDCPNLSPPRRGRHDSPDLSPPRKRFSKNTEKLITSTDLPPRRTRNSSPDVSPARCKRHDSSDSSSAGNAAHSSDSDLSPPRKRQGLSPIKQKNRRTTGSSRRWQHSDSDLSPPRKRCQHSSDSDLSPPRRKRPEASDTEYKLCSNGSELLPAGHRLPSRKLVSLRGQGASWDMSPSRKSQGNEMLSGGQTGLISTDILRKEKEHRRQKERAAEHLADDSRHATTIFRDKSGKKRDLDQERIEHKKKEEEKAAKQEKYAQWGKGVAQEEQQRKNVQDALHEMQKPLARHIDDEDLDRFLREKQRDGDPMAGLLRKKKEKEAKNKNARPVYSGPAPPPNRFNLQPGYRWDGVDRSNGFEQKRYARLADKKAVQEIAYKWSVEDM
ncbi:BUD13 homolog [Rhincodon typus]|uniref:BUD13 homolog n=1 Tax=Rhincodon typus TaxID=259920 RepID=UPI00202E436F|nr:BUD13 homolog [Rhincodon typus]